MRINYKAGRIILPALFILILFFNLSIGSVKIPISQIFNAPNQRVEFLIWHVRFPRVLMGIIAGAALSLVGSIFQTIMKNPLVDPYLIGTSAGAGFGAVLAIYTTVSFNKTISVSVFSFLFSLLASFLTIILAKRKNIIPVTHLILSGVLISTIFSSATILLINLSRKTLTNAYIWLFGSLSGISIDEIYLPLVSLLLLLTISYIKNKELDAIALGEEEAKLLGVETEKIKWLFYLLGSFVISIIVSKTGIIGFVGLIIPHAARILTGSKHRYSLWSSTLLGGIFLSISDTIARTIASPIEIPIGVITSFIGAPLMFILLKTKK
ncbi:ABC transporter permease [Thermosipho melanesiensis]|uniref:Transport system permease protein n=2 Tax=Thermosipho melanesiensis TaxID=46541 RepID=A6LJ17_THEM4|nr:iron ABC transporter permease [Thermosipho melanesiensis]ABR29918.1 transport system permease protein [Thermosipho melanesiensis BI429]APT73126.1 ABC transporter permease [Thermosipho melanesiensis]OOC38524.1 ABC transporter permease [Thermosipho melanesiensis]OOC40328.1 ABC transporter permease [Thermosipho melanesiensis]OOC40592.1 ABC transporter permease [Thermosipho melanesiensis]